MGRRASGLGVPNSAVAAAARQIWPPTVYFFALPVLHLAYCYFRGSARMPRHSKVAEQTLPQQTLVIDNGSYTIKAGFVSGDPKLDECRVVPNCIGRDRGKKVWIGAQLERCTDFGEIVFRRPVEKGYLVNWEAEKAIWDNTFIDQGARLKVCLP